LVIDVACNISDGFNGAIARAAVREISPMVEADLTSWFRSAGGRPTRLRRTSSALPLLRPIQRASLEDQVYARLRAAIVERTILPGQRVPVDRLASEFGISRTPILNALKRLAQERVVDCVSRRGIFVRRFDKREMAQLFEVREALEGIAARLAATRIGAAEVRRFTGAFRSLARSSTPDGVRRYIARDREFHARLVALAGNPHLTAALDSVNMMFFAYQDGLVRPPKETVPEHLALLEALRRRDADAAEAAMRFHLRRSIERLEAEAAATEARAVEPPGNGPRGRRPRRRSAPGHRRAIARQQDRREMP
jgi:DNA-binding GntR family transcriptional regulator